MVSKSLLLLLCFMYPVSSRVIKQVDPDLFLDSAELIIKYGYPLERHMITTDDGYILETQRIPHGRSNSNKEPKVPILLVPGLLCGSAIWVDMGIENSLGFILADQGYDVWLANYRGTTHSRQHVSLDPDLDEKEFFDFSFQEIGAEDLKSNIDYILNQTQYGDLFYIGHSQGTTSAFALTSTRPEYNGKIRLLVALAPVVYTTNIEQIIILIMKEFYNLIEIVIDVFDLYEFLPHNFLLTLGIQILCNDDSAYQSFCAKFLYFIAGPSNDFNPTHIPVIGSNVPAGGSIRSLLHYVQISMADKFQHYDFGKAINVEKYGQPTPPLYNLSAISTQVALYYTNHDTLSTVKDVERLILELPNAVVTKYIDALSHLDYLWATHVVDFLYNDIIDILKQLT